MIKIGKKDIYWNYLATLLRLASSILLFPVILKFLPTEMVGIYTIFMTVNSFVVLLDFGFNPSFTRNITYVFSGANELFTEGFQKNTNKNVIVNYNLLATVIYSMKYFYKRISIISFFGLITLGTIYINYILQKYSGNKVEIYITWILLCFVSSYNLYMSYLDCLVQGKGLIALDKKINVIGQIIYLLLAVLLIVVFKLNLIALIIAQFISVIYIRYSLNNKFYANTPELISVKNNSIENKIILSKISHNAVKLGLTSLGGLLITKSSIFIGSIYLSLDVIASYGITSQIIGVISGLSVIYLSTNVPKIVSLRVNNSLSEIKKIYFQSLFIMILIYLIGGALLIFLGPYILTLLNSKTILIATPFIILLIISNFIDSNIGVAGTILLTKNYVPFFKASLISGFFIVFALLLGFFLFEKSLWIMILAPMLVTISYQAWKWPSEVIKDL